METKKQVSEETRKQFAKILNWIYNKPKSSIDRAGQLSDIVDSLKHYQDTKNA